MNGLAVRVLENEIMDQPGLDVAAHQQALTGIGRVNWISGIERILWNALLSFRSPENVRPLRVFDLACGGGDVSIQLAQRAVRQGIPIEFTGVDISQTAVDFAQSRAKNLKLTNIQFRQCNVLRDPWPGACDVAMSSLFLHHLNDSQALVLLQRMAKLPERGFLLDDLCRSRLGYFLAWCGVRLLTRSSIVHFDGPASVRAAYQIQEVRSLAVQAGLSGMTFQRHWPQRFLMAWKSR